MPQPTFTVFSQTKEMSVASETEKPVPSRRRLAAKPHSIQDKVFFGVARSAAVGAVAIVGLILSYLERHELKLLGKAWGGRGAIPKHHDLIKIIFESGHRGYKGFSCGIGDLDEGKVRRAFN